MSYGLWKKKINYVFCISLLFSFIPYVHFNWQNMNHMSPRILYEQMFQILFCGEQKRISTGCHLEWTGIYASSLRRYISQKRRRFTSQDMRKCRCSRQMQMQAGTQVKTGSETLWICCILKIVKVLKEIFSPIARNRKLPPRHKLSTLYDPYSLFLSHSMSPSRPQTHQTDSLC